MVEFYELSDTFTKFGLCNTLIANMFFIYLTVFHIKKLMGTYKHLVLIFSLLGILFSAWELVARPFVHNYNKAFMMFSLNTWWEVPQDYIQLALVIYVGFYTCIMSFITVQFIYRYLRLASPKLVKKLEGRGIVICLVYPLFCGVCFALSLGIFLQPDEYGDSYLETEIQRVYLRNIKEIPRLHVIPYASDDSLRWWNIYFLISSAVILGSQYVIIIICGYRMRKHIKQQLQGVSMVHRKLERQFYKALVVQIMLPTVLFVLPAGLILLFPLLDFEVSIQSGGTYALFSLYPPLDSIAFMCIVEEYKTVAKGLYEVCFPDKKLSNPNRAMFSVTTRMN